MSNYCTRRQLQYNFIHLSPYKRTATSPFTPEQFKTSPLANLYNNQKHIPLSSSQRTTFHYHILNKRIFFLPFFLHPLKTTIAPPSPPTRTTFYFQSLKKPKNTPKNSYNLCLLSLSFTCSVPSAFLLINTLQKIYKTCLCVRL